MIRLTVSLYQSGPLLSSLMCTQNYVNKTIVITSSQDFATLNLCQEYKTSLRVECFVFDSFHKYNATFNKGLAYRTVQKKIHNNMKYKHVLLMDADICLSSNLWNRVISSMPVCCNQLLSLTDRCIYKTPQNFINQKYHISKPSQIGYRTMGFFQLYQLTRNAPLYPENYKTAAASDQVFGQKFSFIKRINGLAHHMGSTDNWLAKHKNENKNWKNFSFTRDCLKSKQNFDRRRSSFGSGR